VDCIAGNGYNPLLIHLCKQIFDVTIGNIDLVRLMKTLFHCCVVIITLGTSLALLVPDQTMAEQITEPSQGGPSEKQSINEPVPELKPDLPKMAEPRQEHPPRRRQLKGSVQHREIIQSPGKQQGIKAKEKGQFDGSADNGKLNGSLSKGMFKLKDKRIFSGINRTTEAGLGIIGLKFAVYFGRTPVIYQVFSGTPAAAAGLKPRDTIIAVDGIPTFGLSKNEVYNMIVGKPGTEVTISYTHNHDYQTRTLTRMDVNEIPDPRVRRDYLNM
jgi:S1-C subfamily serine protease